MTNCTSYQRINYKSIINSGCKQKDNEAIDEPVAKGKHKSEANVCTSHLATKSKVYKEHVERNYK